MADLFFSVGELADVLKCSTKYLYQRLKAGEIPGSRKIGSVWYVHRQTFLDSFTKPQAQEARRPVGRHNL